MPRAERISQVAQAPRILLVGWLPPRHPPNGEPLLHSLRQQRYPHWQLWLVGSEPIAPASAEIILSRTPGEERLRLARGEASGWSRARAVNEIVAAASDATHVGFLDVGDRLSAESLVRLAERILGDDPDILYTDEDQRMPRGRRRAPRFKPEWSPEFLLSYHYFGHLTVYRRGLYLDAGGLRGEAEGSLEYDLALRATEKASRVAHVPHVLCHRSDRRGRGFRPVLGSQEGEQGAEAALREALARRGVPSRVERGRLRGSYRVRPEAAASRQLSIIVPTRDRADLLERCVRSLERFTPGDGWELIVVDNGSREARTLRYLKTLRHRVLTDPGTFNFARLMNAAAREAAGDVLLFLNNDTQVRYGWSEALLEALALPGVGAAGATLVYPGGTVQHAGLVLGIGVIAGNSHKHLPASAPGYLGSLQVMRNYSAVSAACMAVDRSAFHLAGGFDEALASSFQDVDLCLRLGRLGWRTIYTPFCVVEHHETASRGRLLDEREISLMRERWGTALKSDPCYHPLLTREHESFEMAP